MKNRYGDVYDFLKISDNEYKFVGEVKYCRFGGKEGQQFVDVNDLGFFDPSGGPFISEGFVIEGRKVNRIKSTEHGIFLEVEAA